MVAVIDLAKHVDLIVSQLEFLAQHAKGGVLREEPATIRALIDIATALRSAAQTFDREREFREQGAEMRAQRNAMLTRDCEQQERKQ